jgi:hypothetical protein
MVATAMAENENTFSRLWDCADEIVAGEKSVLLEEAVDILKARGRLASSTAIAVRQSLSFGQTFERALSHLVAGAEPSVLLAEALRFAARVSAGMEQLPVDDVLACDELLETLGLGELTADVEPAAMIDALKAERFLRTNRFLLALPQVIGRVRLSSVTDELLAEHVGAWCDAHRAS